jgi:hypothetical protein
MTTRSQKDVNSNAIMEKLNSMEARMDAKLDQMSEKFDAKLDEYCKALKTDIKNELLPKISENEKKISDNAMEIRETQHDVQGVENTMELLWKSNDLIARGVPVLADENVKSLYDTIAVLIGYDATTTPRAHVQRLGRKQPNSKIEPPILISFTCRLDKVEFYRKYFANVKKLTLSALGFQSTSRFYLSENLTKQNQKIFSEALKLKKANKLHTVSTASGIVWVRQKKDDAAKPIGSMTGLDGYRSDGDDD